MPSEELHKVVVLGAGGVGKTAFILKGLLGHFPEEFDPTIEDTYRKQFNVDKQTCRLEVLDTAGQEEYVALREQWIRLGEGFVLVYSITARPTFALIQQFYNQVRRVKASDDAERGEQPASWPLFLLGSKSDLHRDREVTSAEGVALAKELGCQFFECSSKSQEDVDQIFIEMIREFRNHRQLNASMFTAQEEDVVQSAPSSQKLSKFRRLMAVITRQPAPVSDQVKMADLRALNVCLVNASRINDHRAVQRFLTKGADPNGQPGVDGAALHAAAAFGHLKIIKLLLKNGAAVNAKGPRDVTALQIAAAEGHSAVTELLLKEGAKVNEVSGLHGTALAAGASRARLDTVSILLKHRADPNVSGGPYGNAMQAAVHVGSAAVVELLLNEGARAEARGEGDCTALQVACFAGHLTVVKLLLSRGVYIDAPGGKYGSALKAANDYGKAEIVKLLLASGASATGVHSAVASQTTEADVSTQELQSSAPELPLRHQTASELGAPHFHIPAPPPLMPPRMATHQTLELAS